MVSNDCTYRLEKYTKVHSIGIRQKFGKKKQVFSVSSKTKPWDDLVRMAEHIVHSLQHDGWTEEMAKQWAEQQLSGEPSIIFDFV